MNYPLFDSVVRIGIQNDAGGRERHWRSTFHGVVILNHLNILYGTRVSVCDTYAASPKSTSPYWIADNLDLLLSFSRLLAVRSIRSSSDSFARAVRRLSTCFTLHCRSLAASHLELSTVFFSSNSSTNMSTNTLMNYFFHFVPYYILIF